MTFNSAQVEFSVDSKHVKTPNKEAVLKILRNNLAKATPYEMGVAESEEAQWQLIRVLTDDNPVIGDGMHDHRWHVVVVETQKWLFLEVVLREQRLNYSFAIDCNSTLSRIFLKRVLRSKRLMVGFSNGQGLRLDPSPADSLVEDNGDMLEALIPGWQEEYFP